MGSHVVISIFSNSAKRYWNSVISNSKPFPLDFPFSRLLSAVSNCLYFEQFSVSPASLK